MATTERALVTGGFFLFSGSVLLLCVRRKRDRHRLWRQRVTFKKISKTYVCAVRSSCVAVCSVSGVYHYVCISLTHLPI